MESVHKIIDTKGFYHPVNSVVLLDEIEFQNTQLAIQGV